MYGDKFKNFVSKGIGNYYIGTGNPNSNTLLIGKESAIDTNDIIGRKWYDDNALSWATHIESNTCEILEYPVEHNHPLRAGWGKNTWSKYQKLSDTIREKESKPYYIDFLKHSFTTEINDAPMLKTSEADKSGIRDRKLLFKYSKFIQDFSVIVLACSDYIKNNDDVREIDDIFGVTYAGDEKGKYWYNKGNWFFLHYSPDFKKLVIHTRQLSADVKNELLTDMGTTIRKHLIKIGEIESTNR